MNIAIMHCHKSFRVCTGASCFIAFNEKIKSFDIYKDKDVKLIGYFDCSGCETDLSNYKNFLEKIDRLKKENVERIHVGKCINEKCEKENEIINMLKANGFDVIRGTH